MLGLIPRPFIDELIHRSDIVEFIDAHVPLKKRGTSYIACCPFHNEKTPSFNVVAKKQFYHCFGCGNSGNIISFAMNYLHLSFSEAVETLATRLGMEVPREGRTEKQASSQTLYDCLTQVAGFYQQQLKTTGAAAIAYLKQRRLNAEVVRLYQLGYAPGGWHVLENQFKAAKQELIASGMLIVKEGGSVYDRYRDRLMFPIHDRKGRVIGFGGRAISDQTPKYLNSPETTLFQKSRELYGLYQVLQQQGSLDYLLVVEGYMDVIALAQYGIKNAVATLGTATSAYHVQLLMKYSKQVIFCFDGDAAGRQAAWRALEASLAQVNLGFDARFMFLPEGHDPDSLVRDEGKESFLQQVTQAIPLHQLFIDTLMQGLSTGNLAGKTQLLHKAKPYLLKMVDGPYKQLLLAELTRITHIEAHRIQALLLEDPAKEEPAIETQTFARTPGRVAIALLLQTPGLYEQAKAHLPASCIDIKKPRLLKVLLQQVAQQPNTTTAQWVEAWRGTPAFESLLKLATWDHQVPEAALLPEFIDIIIFLAKQERENTIQQLLQKAHASGLSEEERLQLQDLLKKRHQTIV